MKRIRIHECSQCYSFSRDRMDSESHSLCVAGDKRHPAASQISDLGQVIKSRWISVPHFWNRDTSSTKTNSTGLQREINQEKRFLAHSQLWVTAQYHLRAENIIGSCPDYKYSETTFSEFSAIHRHLFLNYTMLVNFLFMSDNLILYCLDFAAL